MNPGLQNYENLFGRRSTLDRDSLPSPIQYLTERGLLPKRPRGKSVEIRCPIHKGGEEKRESMLVSLVDGHFKCMACGVKGGDVVTLHRLVTGLSFRDAVKDLGGRFHD